MSVEIPITWLLLAIAGVIALVFVLRSLIESRRK
jgi:hypothetical protein